MKYTALIIDDEPIITDSIKSILEDSQIFKSIVVAKDGIDACRKIDNQVFQFIVVDINMPKLDGIGVIQHIREIDRFDPEILLISGGFNQKNVQLASKYKVKHVLAKPFDVKKFVYKLKDIIKDMNEKS